MSKETIYTITSSNITLEKLTDEIKIDFFGDVHRDAPNCDVDRWQWYLKKAKQYKDNHYFFGMGDYTDMASTRERRSLKSAGLHETTEEALDLLAERNNRTIAQELSFMGDRLIGLISGNHRWNFLNGKSSDDDLCERLKCQNLGWLTYHRIRVFVKNTEKRLSIDIVACHGLGGGKLVGTSINKVNDLKVVFPMADIYIMGHDHQRLAVPVSALEMCQNTTKIKQKRQWLIRSGSFQKSYEPNTSSFSISRLMRPADMGVVTMTIGFHRDCKGTDQVITDIRCEY